MRLLRSRTAMKALLVYLSMTSTLLACAWHDWDGLIDEVIRPACQEVVEVCQSAINPTSEQPDESPVTNGRILYVRRPEPWRHQTVYTVSTARPPAPPRSSSFQIPAYLRPVILSILLLLLVTFLMIRISDRSLR